MQNHPSARLLAEFVGTFVFVGAGAAAVVGTGAGPNEIAAIAFAHGLAIMVFAFAFGNLSGAVSSTHDGFRGDHSAAVAARRAVKVPSSASSSWTLWINAAAIAPAIGAVT